VKQGSEIAPRPSAGSGRSEPAELLRRPSTPLRTDSGRSKEFLFKKFSELCGHEKKLKNHQNCKFGLNEIK
jgi:hypothetical protein